MGRRTKKHLLLTAGIMSLIIGVSWTFPSFIQEKYTFVAIASVLSIGGVILIAISLGD